MNYTDMAKHLEGTLHNLHTINRAGKDSKETRLACEQVSKVLIESRAIRESEEE